MSDSLLYEFAKTQGASFKDWFGVNLPDVFKDFSAELRTARTGSAWFDSSFRSIIEISGADAASLIDRITSNNIQKLGVGESAQTGFLNPHAKVLATAFVLKKKDSLWLETQANLAEKLKSYIEKFIFSEDAKLTDKSRDLVCIGIEGPSSEETLIQLGMSPPRSMDSPVKPGNDSVYDIEWNKIPLTIFARSWSVNGGFSIFTPSQHLHSFLAKLERVPWAGMKTLNLLRIEKGVPWYGLDMDENYLLPETGLEEAISYSKGCYTGQEIVARIKSRGQLKRKLARLLIQTSSTPAPNTEVKFKDQTIGHITSAEFDPEKKVVQALGYLKVEYITPSNSLAVGESKAVIRL